MYIMGRVDGIGLEDMECEKTEVRRGENVLPYQRV